MTTKAPVKREIDIPIVEPLKPEPKRLNPGTPAPLIIQPLKTPAREPLPVRQEKSRH